MTNIVSIQADRTAGTDKVLEEAKGQFTSLICLGYTEDGDMVSYLENVDAKDVVYLLEWLKQQALLGIEVELE